MRRKNEIFTIMKDGHPYTYGGFKYIKNRPSHDDKGLIDELPDDKYKEAMQILSTWFIKSNKTSLRHTSYGMKHWLEDAIDHYVSNNQLKDAMIRLGFEPSNYDELNWCFKVKPTPELKKFLERTNRYW